MQNNHHPFHSSNQITNPKSMLYIAISACNFRSSSSSSSSSVCLLVSPLTANGQTIIPL